MSRMDDKYEGVYGESSRRVLDRGEFLRLAGGAGVGISLSGGLGLFGSGQSHAAEILSGDRFPVGLWWPPPPEETTDERYREIAEAGFNFVVGGNENADDPRPVKDANNAKALEAAAANGLRFILHDGPLRRAIDGTSSASGERSFSSGSAAESPMRDLRLEEERRIEEDGGGESRAFEVSGDAREEIRERITAILDLHGDSPALAGVNLYDEPGAGLFGNIAHAKNVLQELDGTLLPYVNVWPSYASPAAMGARDYPTYLQRYTSTVGPPMLSFDHYPLLGGKAHTRDYFYNWEVVRRSSLQAGIPSWVFIQSVDFDGRAVGLAPRRRPSQADLLWQINVSLAYGAKGIQYFTYWTPENARASYGQALISKSGDLTPLYDYARSANGYLSAVGQALSPMRSELVVHAGVKKPPFGAKPFRRDAYVSSVSGPPIVMGWFRRPGADRNARFLFVVNRSSFTKSANVLTMNPRVSAISRFSPAGRRFVPIRKRRKERGPRKLRAVLAPGAAQLLQIGRR